MTDFVCLLEMAVRPFVAHGNPSEIENRRIQRETKLKKESIYFSFLLTIKPKSFQKAILHI